MHSFQKLAVAKTLSLPPMVYLLLLLALPSGASSQARIVNATVDTSKTGAPISKNIYGQFLEHGGDIVNTGVWSEMLVDRKFFYPVVASAPTPPPVMGNAAGNPRSHRTPTRWWAPVGGDDVVTMDTKMRYTGDQSPLVKLDAKEAHGFRQSGIAVRQGKSYIGRIVLAGSPGTVVKVTLIWRKEATDRQTVTIRQLGTAFRKFPLRYTGTTDTDDAILEITGTGTGSFHVGVVSLMPADNIEGFRPEVIAALKQLRFGVLRFPGGNFVSSYGATVSATSTSGRPSSIPSGTPYSPTMSAPMSSSFSAIFLVSIPTSPSTPASEMPGRRANWSNTRTAPRQRQWVNGALKTDTPRRTT